MRLGARWPAGQTPHQSVPAELHHAIQLQESLHPSAQSWTLTWLEGRPRADLDGEVLLTMDDTGQVILVPRAGDAFAVDLAEPDDSWLN